MDEGSDEDAPTAIHVNIPPRIYLLPTVATAVGICLGAIRGSREESLRFLAENAHRRPTTVQGWYFYNKTKNYRVLLAGLKGSGREAAKLGGIALGWVGLEEGCRRIGGEVEEWSAVVAGGGTAAVVSGIYRLGSRLSVRAAVLGSIVGGAVTVMRKSQSWIKNQQE